MGAQSGKFNFAIGRTSSDDLAYELISENGSNEEESEDELVEGSTILQFTSALYFVEENEGAVIIDIMRLGSQNGVVGCSYHTEDMSGKSGKRYEATEGVVTFENHEHQKSVSVPIVVSEQWSPTTEFKVCMAKPKGCMLGAYLHTCRVKVIDDETFPSARYDEFGSDRDAIESVGHSALFLEFCKMNINVPGNLTRTLVVIAFDQLRNAYTYYKLWAISYMLNENLNTDEALSALSIDERSEEAFWIGFGYILPMLFLHAWDLAKVKIDLGGHSRAFLQRSIVTKYLNFNADSRSEIEVADIEIAVREDAAEVSEAYVAALALMRICVKLVVILYFVWAENPRALRYVLGMLAIMGVFGGLRSNALSKANELPLLLSARVLAYVAEIGKNYRLIANYFQRPHTNDTFDQKVSALRTAQSSPNTVRVNNDYFTLWLGPLFIGIYIMTHARSVLTGRLGHGTFVATLNVFNEMSNDFSEGYKESMKITSIAGILANLTRILNLPTDLLPWKAVNRKRRASTTIARQEVLDHPTDSDHPFPTDLIPFEFKGVGFSFSTGFKFLHNINLTVVQGSMVAVLGQHGQGRQTFLSLIGHEFFPTDGEIFIPTHLRILHVSQELYLLDSTALLNLTFGHATLHGGTENERVKCILERLGASKVLNAVYESENQEKSSKTTGSTPGTPSSLETDDWGEYSALGQNALGQIFGDDDPEYDNVDVEWLKRLSYSERAKLHLARAFIMNPEVMVLQRPLIHFDHHGQQKVLDLLEEHVRNRGLGLPEKTKYMRRPRTVFLSVESAEQAQKADLVWTMNEPGSSTSVSVVKDMNPRSRSTGTALLPRDFTRRGNNIISQTTSTTHIRLGSPVAAQK